MPEIGNFRFKNPQDLKNPLRAPGFFLGKATELSDLWLPIRINGDVGVLKGIMKEMLAEEERNPGTVFDRDFIRDYTFGFDAFIADLRAASWDDILVSSGVTREQIRAAAEIAMKAKRIICCWAMGLTQHKNAVATIQEIMNFLLLGGNIGRPGAGPCPVRGHSNVQGDRTMGVWERMNEKFMKKLGDEFHFDPPQEHGTDTVETIKEMHRGHIRVFVAMGGNFLSATPDTEYTAKALQQLPAHRARRDQAQSLPSGHRRNRADSPLPWPLRNRSAGGGRAVCHGRGFDGHHQSVAGRSRAGERAFAQRARHRGRSGPGHAGRSEHGRLGGVSPPITIGSATTSSMSFRDSSASTSGSRRTFSICRTTRATTGNLTTRSGKAKFTVASDPAQRIGARAATS